MDTRIRRARKILRKKLRILEKEFSRILLLPLKKTSVFIKIISSLTLTNYIILSSLIFILISVLTFSDIFSITFWNDDWLGIYWLRIEPKVVPLFSPYGTQIHFFDALSRIFGYYQPLYYLTAMILRIISSLILLLTIYFLTKSRSSAFLASLIFLVGFSGIQAMVEPVNMIGFLAVTFTGLFLIFFFKNRQETSVKNYISFTITFLLAVLVLPIRLYPLIIWAFLADLIWLYINPNIGNVKKFLIRQGLMTLIFLFILQQGNFGPTSTNNNNFFGNLKSSINSLQKNPSQDIVFLSNSLTGLGNTILPDERRILFSIKKIEINTILGGLYFLAVILTAYLTLTRRQNKYGLLLSFLLWLPLFYFAYLAIALSLDGEVIFNSQRRYLVIPFAGFSIALGLLFSLALQSKQKIIIACSIVLILGAGFIHAFTLKHYLAGISLKRNFQISNIFWTQLKTQVPALPFSPGYPALFYIQTPGTAFEEGSIKNTIHESVFIGFPTHAAVLYNIPKTTPSYNPHPVGDLDTLISLIKDGKPLIAQGYPAEPVSWDRIYAFQFDGKDLINIKPQIMQKVESIINE